MLVLLARLVRLLMPVCQWPCCRAFGSHDGSVAARELIRCALRKVLAVCLAVLLGMSGASAPPSAAERRLMVTAVNRFPGIHTPFPSAF